MRDRFVRAFFASPREKFASARSTPNKTDCLALACTLLPRICVQHAIEIPNMFAPVSTPAFAIREVSFFVLAITAMIFVIVAGFTIYTLIRFGRRPASLEVEPAQVYGSTQIELAWTIVPLLIVVVLFLVTARYTWGIERRAQPPDALEITVVGNQ